MPKKREKPIRFNMDAYRDAMEDALRDHESESEFISAEIAENRRKNKAKLESINRKLVDDHDISNPISHLLLIHELIEIMGVRSSVDLGADNWRVPSDNPLWKETRTRQLEPIARGLLKIIEKIDAGLESKTFRQAVIESDLAEKFSDGYAGLLDIFEIFATAASIRGPEGNTPNPDWMIEFGRACQKFWFAHQHGGTGLKFKYGGAIEGANQISEWVVDVYLAIIEFLGQRPRLEKMRNELEGMNAYRPEKHPN